TQIQRDPIQPRRKFRLSLEAGQRPVRTEERVLTDVARVLLPTENAIRQGIDRPLPSHDELIEAVHVAQPGPGDKLLISARHQQGTNSPSACKTVATFARSSRDDHTAGQRAAPPAGR